MNDLQGEVNAFEAALKPAEEQPAAAAGGYLSILLNGKFFYFEMGNCLNKLLSSDKNLLNKDLKLNLHLKWNIDGVSLFKSSKVNFWPILLQVNDCDASRSLVLDIFCGISKP